MSTRTDDEALLSELVDVMYSSLHSLLVIGLAVGAIGGMLAFGHDEIVGGAIGLGLSLVAFARCALTLSYKKAASTATLQTVSVRRWERGYAIGGVIFSAGSFSKCD